VMIGDITWLISHENSYF